MLISSSKKFIFVHNQKTAGASIVEHISKLVPDSEMLLPHHAYAVDGIEKIGREQWDEYYSFGFVRNPWERLASWYSMIVASADTSNNLWNYVRNESTCFGDFLQNCTDTITENRNGFVYNKSFVKNQIDYFTDKSGNVAVKFIGRFENIQKDYNHILEALNLPQSPLPHINVGTRKSYKDMYTAHSRELVADRFKKDIETFGYTF